MVSLTFVLDFVHNFHLQNFSHVHLKTVSLPEMNTNCLFDYQFVIYFELGKKLSVPHISQDH